MRNSTCKLLCAVLALCMVLTLAACGKDKAAAETTAKINIAGTYVLTSMEYEGQVLKKEELDLLGLHDYECYVILQEDGTGTLVLEGDVSAIRWGEGKLWAEDDETDSTEFTADGKTVSIVIDGVTATFTAGKIPDAPPKEETPQEEQPTPGVDENANATTYRISGAEIDGELVSQDDLSLLGLTPASCYITLRKDGTGTFCLGTTPAEITWEDGKILDPVSGEVVMTYTLSGNTLSIEEEGITLIYTVSSATAAKGDRYTLVSAEMEGEALSSDDLTAMGISPEESYLELYEDGTGLLALMGMTQAVEWKDNSIWITGFADQTITFTLEGDLLTMDLLGLVLVLQKN